MMNKRLIAALVALACGSTLMGQTFLGYGVDTNVPNVQTTNYTVARPDCGRTIQSGTGSSGFISVSVPSTTGFPANCSVVIVNGDSGRAKSIIGVTLPYSPGCGGSCLWPQQSFAIKIENGAWMVVYAPGRWRAPGGVVCNVDVLNGNDNNDCLASGSGGAVKTLFQAMSVLANTEWDLTGDSTPNVTFQLADNNTCTAGASAYIGLHLSAHGVGYAGNATYIIQGDAVTPSNTCISDTTSPAIAAFDGARVQLKNLKMVSPAGQPTVQVDGGGSTVRIETGVIFGGSTTSADMFIENSAQVLVDGSYTIAGASAFHVLTVDGGGFNVAASATVTCTASPAYTDFILLQRNSRQNWTNATFSGCGSVTGTRYLAQGTSQIETGGGGANFFPGNSAGVVLGGSAYDGNAPLPISSGGTGASSNGATAVGNISGATPISSCSGAPSGSFAVTNGIVTHC